MTRDHLTALLEAFFVTFLWSSSYVLVKVGLQQLTPLSLVALRYLTATVVLAVIAFRRGEMAFTLDRRNLVKTGVLGVSGYTIAQGLQCIGLFYLPAVSVTFILNFTPVIVLVLGVLVLGESPRPLQLGGMGLVLLGAYLYFNKPLSEFNVVGVLITLVSGLGWAVYLILSRYLFLNERVSPLELTFSSMSMGTLILVLSALAVESLPSVSPMGWAIILWLGVVNTALAFFLWNHALQRLEAFEISVLQNTMLAQIALLAWFFLGEQLTGTKILAMALVFLGALVVQLRGQGA